MVSFMAVIPVGGYSLQSDGLYISMEPDSVKTVIVTLPDDSGAVLKGKNEYTVTLEPLPNETWADFSEQVVRTDENNTVLIPIRFSTLGKEEGECSSNFTLTIDSVRTVERKIPGEVCVSKYPDVDERDGGTDLFDISVDRNMKYLTPGEKAEFTVYIQSYADINLDLSVEGDVEGYLTRENVRLNESHPRDQVELLVQPEEIGEYRLRVVGDVEGCSESVCSKRVDLGIVVKEEKQEEGGFAVSLLPRNVNLRGLRPVDYKILIYNSGDRATFDVSVEVPEGLKTDFQGRSIVVGEDSSGSVEFQVEPTEAPSFYNLAATISSGNVTKSVDSHLSTNEMLTDSLRDVEQTEGANRSRASSEVDSWYSDYKNQSYGKGLEEYSRLKGRLDKMKGRKKKKEPEKNGGENGEDKQPGPAGPDIGAIIIPVVILIVAGAAVFVYFFKIRATEEEEFY